MTDAGAAVLEPHVSPEIARKLAENAWILMARTHTAATRRPGRPLKDPAAYARALAEYKAGASLTTVQRRYRLSPSLRAKLKAERTP